MTQEQIEDGVVRKLQGVFRPDENKIGSLVSRIQGSNRTDIVLGLEKEGKIAIGFGNRQERHADIKVDVGEYKKFEPVYFPPKEMIPPTIQSGNRPLLVILFLEGNFGCESRRKSMIMKELQSSIRKKLIWLNCLVSVVDSNTYCSKLFKVG